MRVWEPKTNDSVPGPFNTMDDMTDWWPGNRCDVRYYNYYIRGEDVPERALKECGYKRKE